MYSPHVLPCAGKYIITASSDGAVHILTTASLNIMMTYRIPFKNKALCLCLSPGCGFLAVGSDDTAVYVFKMTLKDL